jgi:K+-transporting ATPase ATPase A chain
MSSFVVLALCLLMVAACIKPLGLYMAAVYEGHAGWLDAPLGWLERLIYRLCGIRAHQETGWRGYAVGVLMLGLIGFLLLFAIFTAQEFLPLNPQHWVGLPPDLAFNAAISFVTNTNWQSYGGENTLSNFSQMMGCGVQNFLSAATGMAVAVALFRALARKQVQTIGNPYVDVVRGTLYILLPLSLIFAIFLSSQGVVQTLDSYAQYQPIETQDTGDAGQKLIALGPVASQVAIKMLGSNGGGFFNANAAHPFENPNPDSHRIRLCVRRDCRRPAAGLDADRGDERYFPAAADDGRGGRAACQPALRAWGDRFACG